jgi:EAL domain
VVRCGAWRDPADSIHRDRRGLGSDHRSGCLGDPCRLPPASRLAGCGAFRPRGHQRARSSCTATRPWTLEAEARAAGVPISLIEVEMTESVLVKDSARVRAALERLRQLGCRIALDDFGTGYSSLAGWNGCVSEAATKRRASCYRSPCRCASSNRDFCGRPTCPRDTDCACRLAVSQASALISSRSGLDLVETKLGVLQ